MTLPVLEIILGAAAGLAGGLAFFHALRWNAALYLAPGAPLWRPVALHLLRQAGMAALLVAAVLLGGGAGLLAALGGILLARRLVRPAPAERGAVPAR